MIVKFIAKPRGAKLVDVAIRAGWDEHNLALCGNNCLTLDAWGLLRGILTMQNGVNARVIVQDVKEDA